MLYIALRVGIRKRLAAFWCHFSGAFCPYIEIITNVSNYVSGSVSGLLSAIFFTKRISAHATQRTPTERKVLHFYCNVISAEGAYSSTGSEIRRRMSHAAETTKTNCT